jgi:hypothetical protein
MTEPAQAPATCNTCVAQDHDGRLAVFVNGVKMIGVATAHITPEGNLILGLMSHSYRLASREEDKVVLVRPAPLEVKDNVVSITTPLMDEYRARWAAEGIDPNKE